MGQETGYACGDSCDCKISCRLGSASASGRCDFSHPAEYRYCSLWSGICFRSQYWVDSKVCPGEQFHYPFDDYTS